MKSVWNSKVSHIPIKGTTKVTCTDGWALACVHSCISCSAGLVWRNSVTLQSANNWSNMTQNKDNKTYFLCPFAVSTAFLCSESCFSVGLRWLCGFSDVFRGLRVSDHCENVFVTDCAKAVSQTCCYSRSFSPQANKSSEATFRFKLQSGEDSFCAVILVI